MLFTKTFAAVFGLSSFASAHMYMQSPTRFTSPQVTNGPLDATGNNFPCQQVAGGSYAGAATDMALGSTQPLTFLGQSVHGGGSCQVSFTYDTSPTKNSVWKVIKSFEGGCPAVNTSGNLGDDTSATEPDPFTYSFNLPTNIPTGKGTIAWTWFNRIGNREMYMNCAPVSLTGTSTGSQSNYEALPDMLVANIGGSCNTANGVDQDFKFPNPGNQVEILAQNPATMLNFNGDCGPTGTANASYPTYTPMSSAKSTAAAQPTVSSAKPAASSAAAGGGAGSGGNGGGVFISVPASSAAPAAGTPTLSTTPTAAASTTAAAGAAATAGAQSVGAACSTEGMWNCVGGSSYQQCASGVWSVVMPLAAGTSCTDGESAVINIVASKEKKRAVKFSG